MLFAAAGSMVVAVAPTSRAIISATTAKAATVPAKPARPARFDLAMKIDGVVHTLSCNPAIDRCFEPCLR